MNSDRDTMEETAHIIARQVAAELMSPEKFGKVKG